MNTLQWVVFFIGCAVAVGSVVTWIIARRAPSEPESAPNPGLIASEVTPGPPGSVSPGMVGALLDGRVGARNLFLTMIDLAVRGYLRITATQGDWAIRRTDKPARGLRDFETALLEAPPQAGTAGPSASMTSLFGDTSETLATAQTMLRSAVARAGWFTDGAIGPKRSPWSAIGGGVVLLGLVAAAAALVSGFRVSPLMGLIGAVLMVASGLLLISLTRLQPTVTAVGDRTRGQVQRYRLWLEGLQPHDIVPETAAQTFDDNLAPALAFGLQDRFAEVFDTACARHRNWGKTLAIETPWLDGPGKTLAARVRLLDQFLDDAAAMASGSDFEAPDD